MSVKKYRTRPVVIEAIQLSWENWNAVCDFVDKDSFGGGVHVMYDGSYRKEHIKNGRLGLIIKNTIGDLLAVEGDYIIKLLKGGFFPSKADEFEKMYTDVTEEINNEDKLAAEMSKFMGLEGCSRPFDQNPVDGESKIRIDPTPILRLCKENNVYNGKVNSDEDT